MSKEEQKTSVTISKQLVFINSASTVFTRLLNISVLVWMYQYLLTHITPEEFAIFPVVAAIMVFAPLISAFLTGGVSRYIIEAYAKGDTKTVTDIVSSIFPLIAVFSLFLLGIGMVFSWYVDKVLTVHPGQLWDARIMMALLIFGFVSRIFFLPFTVGFDVKQKYVYLNLIQIVREMFRNAVLLILLLGISSQVMWVVVATVLANFIETIVLTLLSRRMIPELRFQPAYFSWDKARKLMSFGIWTTLGQIAVMVHSGAGAIVLNKLGAAIDVTNYHIAAMFDRNIRSMATLASSPVQPALTAMHSTGDATRLGNAFVRGGRYALIVNLGIACPLFIFSEQIIDLYVGDKFRETAIVMLLLLGLYPFTEGCFMLPKIAMAKAEVKRFFIGAIITQMINLALMIYLTGELKMGAIGVGLAIFSTQVLSYVFYFLPLGLKLSQVSLKRYAGETLLLGLVPAVLSSIVWGALLFYHAPDSWLLLCFYTCVGYCVYALALYFFSMRPDEKVMLFQAIDKVNSIVMRRSRNA